MLNTLVQFNDIGDCVVPATLVHRGAATDCLVVTPPYLPSDIFELVSFRHVSKISIT